MTPTNITRWLPNPPDSGSWSVDALVGLARTGEGLR